MATSQEILNELKRLAQIYVDTSKSISGLDFDYSEASIALLDPMIEENWGAKPPVQLEAVVQIIGAYIGEVISRNLHGQWIENNNGRWVVEIIATDGSKMEANVFYKTQKRLTNGMEDSLGYYYQMMKQMQEKGMPGERVI